jgi:osmotically-inducible protein OsmY
MTKGAAVLTGIAGVAAGTAIMYFTDPKYGRQRLKKTADKMGGVWKDASEAAGKKSRELTSRARGFAESARSTVSRAVRASDEKLAEHVRARIGQVVSHPGAIEVAAHDGRVTLSGSALASEVGELILEASRVRGVAEVENRLRVYRKAENVPELQAEAARRAGWSPALRTIMGVTGGALTAYGMRRRRDALGRAATVLGTGLLARGIASRRLQKIIRMAA